MTYEQTESLLKIIKSFYQYFSITEDVLLNWPKKLKNYDYNDVLEQLDDYIDSGNENCPKIADLISSIKTIEEKELMNTPYLQTCIRCGKRYKTIIERDNCYERDMRIRYIEKMCKKLDINAVDYFGDLRTAKLDTLNQNYSNFIKEIVRKEKEKQVLNQYEKAGINQYWKYVIAK